MEFRTAVSVVGLARAAHGAIREQLAELQRVRLIGAMFDVAAQRGRAA